MNINSRSPVPNRAKRGSGAGQNYQRTSINWIDFVEFANINYVNAIATPQTISNVVQVIAREFQPAQIVLFGSYAKGSATKDSDIDMLIVKESTLPPYRREQDIRRKLIGNGFPALDLIVMTPAEVEARTAAGDFFMKNIISHGKILYHAQ